MLRVDDAKFLIGFATGEFSRRCRISVSLSRCLRGRPRIATTE
jgi:hypothetical protein